MVDSGGAYAQRQPNRARASGQLCSKKGWESFTDAVIRTLAKQRKGLVFLLWGKNAQEKERLIAKDAGHLILKSPHPRVSPHTGFLQLQALLAGKQFYREERRSSHRLANRLRSGRAVSWACSCRHSLCAKVSLTLLFVYFRVLLWVSGILWQDSFLSIMSISAFT